MVDFETASLDPSMNQPVSMAAVMIDGRKLSLCNQGIFYSMINIIPDEEVQAYGLNMVEKKALDVNKLTLEEISKSPPLKTVWNNFENWVKFHMPKKDVWEAPIFCGHNCPYDFQIANRVHYGHLGGKIILPEKLINKTNIKKKSEKELAEAYRALTPLKEPWKFGSCAIWHPAITIDTKDLAFTLFENCREPAGLSLTALRSYFGFKEGEAHNALTDTLFSAEILVRYLRLMRKVHLDTDFNVEGETVLPIAQILEDNKHE